jgi:hypothetical protein
MRLRHQRGSFSFPIAIVSSRYPYTIPRPTNLISSLGFDLLCFDFAQGGHCCSSLHLQQCRRQRYHILATIFLLDIHRSPGICIPSLVITYYHRPSIRLNRPQTPLHSPRIRCVDAYPKRRACSEANGAWCHVRKLLLNDYGYCTQEQYRRYKAVRFVSSAQGSRYAEATCYTARPLVKR